MQNTWNNFVNSGTSFRGHLSLTHRLFDHLSWQQYCHYLSAHPQWRGGLHQLPNRWAAGKRHCCLKLFKNLMSCIRIAVIYRLVYRIHNWAVHSFRRRCKRRIGWVVPSYTSAVWTKSHDHLAESHPLYAQPRPLTLLISLICPFAKRQCRHIYFTSRASP